MTTPSLDVVQAAIGQTFPAITYTYTTRDVSLYALGVGAPADWLDQDELRFVYERSSYDFQVLPSFAMIYSSGMIDTLLTGNIAGIEYNPMMVVHGEQALEVMRPLPPSGTVTCQPRITNIYDKGSGLVIVTEVTCQDEAGATLAKTEASMFIRGIGGFGGERGPSLKIEPPNRAPDAVHEQQTLTIQALIYRLSGDVNPLHADPAMAQIGNFDRPILHGLSTFGFAVRAILKHFCDNDVARFERVRVRFAKPVFPGETLITEMWQTDEGIVFQTKVKERDEIALSHARATLKA